MFFSMGTDGWHSEIRRLRNGKRIKLNQYLRYHIATHDLNNVLHQGRKLFQQYMVDQYCKVESQRLSYLQWNQDTLRADLYQGVQDSLASGDVEQSGRVVILPSSFPGSDRFMQDYYQDSLALVRKYGKPTFL